MPKHPTNAMTQAEYRAMRFGTLPESKPNKYNAVKSVSKLAGRSFDSKLERTRGEQLVAMEQSGEISGLEFQVQTHLTRARIGYKVDFRYVENGRVVYEEAKGKETEGWSIKRRLWKVYGPGPLRVSKRGHRGIEITEEIEVKA